VANFVDHHEQKSEFQSTDPKKTEMIESIKKQILLFKIKKSKERKTPSLDLL